MRFSTLFLLIICPAMAAAECNVNLLASSASGSENGIYYSVTGREQDARRVGLSKINGDPIRLQMRAGQSLNYSFNGKIFVRTGANREPWLNLKVPTYGEEAIVVTSQTRSTTKHKPEYVSLFREEIPAGACFLVENPKGFIEEKGRYYKFISEGKYALFHMRSANSQADETLKDYHFEFGRLNDEECFKTREVYGRRDGKRVLVTSEVYNTWPRDGSPPRLAEKILGDVGSDFAGVIIGSPAYARTYPTDIPESEPHPNAEVSSLMSSLHYINSGSDQCFALPVPIPTSREAGGLRSIFGGDDAHRRKSEELAASGKFLPTMSEFVFKKVVENKTAGFIRLRWTRR